MSGAGLFYNVGWAGRVNLENGIAFVYCALDHERAIKGAILCAAGLGRTIDIGAVPGTAMKDGDRPRTVDGLPRQKSPLRSLDLLKHSRSERHHPRRGRHARTYCCVKALTLQLSFDLLTIRFIRQILMLPWI